MENWFTVERIDDHTYAISEYKHWEQTHCYLLLGTERALLIDTGLGVEKIRRVVESLTSLPLIVVTTHVHWDHIGGHWNFSNIGVHEAERDWLESKFPLPIQMVRSELSQGECDFPTGFFVENYRIYQGAPQFLIHDGDEIDLGGRRVEVLHTPGHSPGHCCFSSRRKATFIAETWSIWVPLICSIPQQIPGRFGIPFIGSRRSISNESFRGIFRSQSPEIA